MGRESQARLGSVAGAIWDLRDHSHDHPEQWKDIDAESVFQVMAEIIERAIDADESMDWIRFPELVQKALLDGRQGSGY